MRGLNLNSVVKDKADLVSISVIEFDSGKKSKAEAVPSEHSEFYKILVEEAPFVYGDHGIQPTNNTMDWLDESLIKKGQAFIRRNWFSVMLAHFISLMLIFTFKSGRSVLLRTGESHRKENSLTRYLSTILHIKAWYETDFVARTSKTSQDVYAVRKMHGSAAANYDKSAVPNVYLDTKQEALLNAIHADCKDINTDETPWDVLVPNPKVPMSQFDMVVTQFCFLGFINLYPRMFGIYESSDEGMNGFVHLWAVLGRLLGIEDRFNLALNVKDRIGYTKIWNNIFMAGFQSTDKYTIVMWDALIYGLSYYVAFLRLNSVTQFMLTHVARVKVTKNVSNLMSRYDHFVCGVMRLSVYVCRFTLFRKFLNAYIRLAIWYARVRWMRKGQHMTPPSIDRQKQKPQQEQQQQPREMEAV